MGSMFDSVDKFCSECKTFIPETLGDYSQVQPEEGKPQQFMCGYCTRLGIKILQAYLDIQKETNANETAKDGSAENTCSTQEPERTAGSQGGVVGELGETGDKGS